MNESTTKHGNNLLSIFPNALDRDPVSLYRKLQRLELKGQAIALRLCNGPQYPDGEQEKLTDDLLKNVNSLLGNINEHQPKTGVKCGCRRGIQRDNCSACEGTGYAIDFHEIRNRKPLVPVFINLDPRGYALKINDEWVRESNSAIHRDWGGYGIIAPEIEE